MMNQDCEHHPICCRLRAVLFLLSLALILSFGSPITAAASGGSRVFKGSEALPESVQKSLTQALSESLREISPLNRADQQPDYHGARYTAFNPENRLQARFLDRKVSFASTFKEDKWQGVFSVCKLSGPARIYSEKNRLEYRYDNGLTEWYVNLPAGIEQGFTFKRKIPAFTGAGGALTVELAVAGLHAEALKGRIPGSSDLQLVNTEGKVVITYTGLKAWDAAGNSLATTMDATADGIRIRVDDRKALYPVTIDPLIATQEQKLTAGSFARTDMLFGHSVSIDGDTALIGAPYDNNDDSTTRHAGSAYVFVRSGTNWTLEQKLIASDSKENGIFGWSVSIDGDTALIGAPSGTGSAAYVFVRSGSTWTEQQELLPEVASSGRGFGCSVSIDGDTALIGANVSQGAYVFVRSGTHWDRQWKLIGSDTAAYDQFGYSVSVDGDIAVIGSPRNDHDGFTNSGSAYVFVRSGVTWTEQQKLTASDAAAYDEFGFSVSIDGASAVISAPRNDHDGIDDLGSAYVFVRSGTTWTEQQKIKGSGAATYVQFGRSVSIDGDAIVVGVPSDDENDSNAGSAFIFIREGTTWTGLPKITALDPHDTASVGYSVGISGNTVLLGAFNDDLPGLGSDSGSAYVFTYHEAASGPTPPTVTTQAVTDITATSAIGHGNITDLGIPNPSQHGVCWSTAGTPTIADNATTEGAASATGAFTSGLTGLTSGATYYVRAYATNTEGTAYGSIVSFTTIAPPPPSDTPPTVTTQAVTDITTTTATAHGNITDLGSPDPDIHGFCWGTSENPTLFNNSTMDLGPAHATGPFSANLTGLSPNTTYHIRAFASNQGSEESEARAAGGISYGQDITFTTAAPAPPPPAPPAVSTQAATAIGSTSATVHGTITDLGSPAPTRYGICWNIAGNPTTADHVVNSWAAAATRAYSFNLTGLSPNTTYHFRFYATNTADTVYGNEFSFTTRAAAVPTLDEWGMILFMALAAWIAMLNLRRKYD